MDKAVVESDAALSPRVRRVPDRRLCRLRKSWAPISGFVCPPAARWAIWSSYGVRSPRVSSVRLRTVSPVAATARYDLRQVPITGIDPESEPSPQHLKALIELVRREQVTTVFFERLVSPRLAETVARDAGAKG